MFPWSFSVFNCTSCSNQFEALKSPRGQFDTGTVKSLHQITCVLSFNMDPKCLKAESSLSQADGSEEKVHKKNTIPDHAFLPRNWSSNPTLGGAFEHPILV